MTAPQPEATAQLTAATLAAEFATATNTIAAQSVEAVTAWYVEWLAGEFTDAEFVDLLAVALDVYSDLGVWTADRMAADLLDRPPIGIRIDDDMQQAHRKAASTMLDALLDEPVPADDTLDQLTQDASVEQVDEPESIITLIGDQEADTELPGRLERLASSEPIAAAQDGLRKAYKAHGLVGYTRGLDADPCELCVWLKKEHLRPGGYVYPITTTMNRHPGCQCVPLPVGTDELPEQTDNTKETA